MNIFDPASATQAQQWAADRLESLFSEFPYIGPLAAVDGSPYLIISIDQGECSVTCLSIFKEPVRVVTLRVPGVLRERLAPGRASMFLRANGAKSDRVPRR